MIDEMIFSNVFFKKLKNPGCSMAVLSNNYIPKPNINESIICICDQGGNIAFFDIDKGNLLHEIPTECNSEIWAIVSVSFNSNVYNLYMGAATGNIYAYRIIIKTSESKPHSLDIKKLWEQKAGDLITKMECYDINQDNKIELIVSSMDHSLRVLNAETGALIWGQLFQTGITTFKLANLNGDIVDSVICSAVDGSLRVFNSKNGDLIKFTTLANNIRNIEVVNTPKQIGNVHINSDSPKVIICGCDDYYLYFIDSCSLNILASFNIGSYIWNSGHFKAKGPQSFDQFYISTYSFNFMEGLVVPNENDRSLLRFYNTTSFEIVGEIADINIQAITKPIDFNKSQFFLVGTTEKKVHLIDLEQKKILYSIGAEDIVNSVEYYIDNNNLMLFYCDDKCNFCAFKIENF